jgi:hypothetical protein
MYQGSGCCNNTRLSHKGKDQGWVKRVGNLVLGNIDIRIPGCWSGRNEDWVPR